MEENLDSLIEKIKEKGIKEAEKKKENIVAAAKAEAEDIIKQAKIKSEQIVKQAETDANRISQQTKNALQQAKRDILLQLKQEIRQICSNLLKREVSSSLKEDFIKDVLLKILDTWMKKNGQKDLEIVLSQEAEPLRDFILAKFRDASREGIKITLSPELERGFFLKAKDNDFYYDFSDESLAEIVSDYLSPKINEILTER